MQKFNSLQDTWSSLVIHALLRTCAVVMIVLPYWWGSLVGLILFFIDLIQSVREREIDRERQWDSWVGQSINNDSGN